MTFNVMTFNNSSSLSVAEFNMANVKATLLNKVMSAKYKQIVFKTLWLLNILIEKITPGYIQAFQFVPKVLRSVQNKGHFSDWKNLCASRMSFRHFQINCSVQSLTVLSTSKGAFLVNGIDCIPKIFLLFFLKLYRNVAHH